MPLIPSRNITHPEHRHTSSCRAPRRSEKRHSGKWTSRLPEGARARQGSAGQGVQRQEGNRDALLVVQRPAAHTEVVHLVGGPHERGAGSSATGRARAPPCTLAGGGERAFLTGRALFRGSASRSRSGAMSVTLPYVPEAAFLCAPPSAARAGTVSRPRAR